MIISFLIYGLALILPILIVCLWKRRPVIAFLTASLLLFIGWTVPVLLQTFQALMIYGTGDPELMAGGISQAIVGTSLAMFIGLPVLAFIQWIARRNYKRAQKQDAPKDIFS